MMKDASFHHCQTSAPIGKIRKREFRQVEEQSPTERHKVVQFIEALVERNQLRREKAR